MSSSGSTAGTVDALTPSIRISMLRIKSTISTATSVFSGRRHEARVSVMLARKCPSLVR